MKNPWVETPLIESTALSRAAGCRIFLKLENLQPSGSFKSRGIGHYMQTHLKTNTSTTTHFYSSSGGNAGLACVHAAKSLGYSATVVVPKSASDFMIAKLRAAGAHDVIQHGAAWMDADKYLREIVMANDEGAVYVSPFDHPDIWTGNSYLVGEVERQLQSLCDADNGVPDVVICSVGGGGLFCGIVQGVVEKIARDPESPWAKTQILALETEGADSLAKSLQAGEHITLPAITSAAKSLGANRVATQTYQYGQHPQVTSVVLSDAEAAMGCWRLADDERLMVELACGVNVALCYDGRLGQYLKNNGKTVTRELKVVIVVCGGSNVTVDMLGEWRKEYGFIEKDMPDVDAVPSQVTAPSS